MASVCISIDDDRVAKVFDRTLNEASLVARDMIEVRTSFSEGTLTKTVRTECPWAFSVIRSALAGKTLDD